MRISPAFLVLGVALTAAALLAGCPAKPAAAPAKGDAAAKGIPVGAKPARTADMGIYLTGLGSIAAFNTVTVRARVDGELVKVAFTEGQQVKAGDLLAEIDPRPFEVQLHQAEGQLARDAALLKNAKIDYDRYKAAEEAVAAQQIATAETTVNQYEGALQVDRAAIESANLNLAYTRITAPIAGRIGLRRVDRGNMVRASDPEGLAVITQLQPIAVLFSLPEDAIGPVLARPDAGRGLVVEAYDRELRRRISSGTLLTTDNQIDASTGTLRFKGVFANEDGLLFPNQFVNARLLVDTLRGAVVVPSAAVQRSPQSTFVYVVRQDSTVDLRKVTAGPSEGEDTAITDGIAVGELVVTDGIDKLQQGTKVIVRRGEAASATSPTSPTSAKGDSP